MDRKAYNDSKKKFKLSLNYLKSQIEKPRAVSQVVWLDASKSRKEELISKIQDIFLNIGKCVVRGEVPYLLVKPRQTDWKDCIFNKRLILKPRNEISCQEVKFTGHEKRFVIICSLLHKINRLLLTKSSVTKREVYYEQTELYGKQTAVNAALLDVCDLLQASIWELPVLSTSKGLVAGNLTIITAEREIINCDKPGGMLVPQDINGISKFKSLAQFILIVEKDAAFQKLLDDGALTRLGPCIIITGKGEPDINTRMLVCRLSRELMIPVLILVDADPYGIEIMCTYRFGSLAMIQNSAELATPDARWVGIHPTDIELLSIPSVPLTNKDFKKTRELSRRPYIQQNEELLSQVNCLLQNGKKSEIENLTSISSAFLTDMFLPYKISTRDYI